jgi:hypothetical protein
MASLAAATGAVPATTTAAQPVATSNPNQQVAPLTQQQIDAMNAVSAQTPGAQGLVNAAQQQQLNTINGQYLDPSSNQYLQAYYNAAAQPLTQQYQQTTAPNIVGNAAQTGTVGSAGENQAFSNANTSLAEGLGNLAAGIYEPAYESAAAQQQAASQSAGNTATAQYVPAGQLAASGQIGQQQAQNVLQTGYENAYGAAQAPYQELSYLGNALGLASGGTGNSVSIGSSTMPSSGGLK